MKTRFTLFLLALLLAGPLLADDQPARPDVDELLAVSHAEQTYGALVQRVIEEHEKSLQRKFASSQNPAQAEALLKEVTKMEQQALSWENLKPLYEKAYAEVYTPDEIKGIVAFYKSPAGQAYVTSMPAMMQKIVGLQRAWFSGSNAIPSPTVSGSGEPIRPDIAELLEAARVKESFERLKDQIQKISQQPGDAATKATNDRTNAALAKLNWDDVKGDYAKVYADTFTPDETAKMIKFYKSPAGQAYLDKRPLLEQKISPIIPNLISTIIPKIRELVANETAGPSPAPAAASGT